MGLLAQLNALLQLYSALYSTRLNFKSSSGVQELPGAACAAKCTLAIYSELYSTRLNFKLSSGVQELRGAARAAKCTLAIVFRTLFHTSKFQIKFWCTRPTWCCSGS